MKTLIRTAACAAVLIAAAAPAVLPQAALAQTASQAEDAMFRATTLNLSAYGETRVAPDMATINLGVNVEAATAQEAMRANATRMNQVIAALKKAGIAERDIQTSNLNLSAQYAYEQNQPPRLTGYQASNQVTIRVNDLGRLGAAVDATVSAGANQVNGISFGLKDSTAAENAAREAAVRALAAKADLYAKATGHRVARLVSLSEAGGYAPQPMPMFKTARMESALAADATSVSGGELAVRIDITGLYELAR